VLYHPDLRPLGDANQYIDQLKPKYASVDITELELPETEFGNNNEPIEINKNLLNEVGNNANILYFRLDFDFMKFDVFLIRCAVT